MFTNKTTFFSKKDSEAFGYKPMATSIGGEYDCCLYQSNDAEDPNYLPQCCVDQFKRDLKPTNTYGHVVGNSYPWPKTIKPAS